MERTLQLILLRPIVVLRGHNHTSMARAFNPPFVKEMLCIAPAHDVLLPPRSSAQSLLRLTLPLVCRVIPIRAHEELIECRRTGTRVCFFYIRTRVTTVQITRSTFAARHERKMSSSSSTHIHYWPPHPPPKKHHRFCFPCGSLWVWGSDGAAVSVRCTTNPVTRVPSPAHSHQHQ